MSVVENTDESLVESNATIYNMKNIPPSASEDKKVGPKAKVEQTDIHLTRVESTNSSEESSQHEENKEETNQRSSESDYLWGQMKKEFYQQRKIVIRNIPPCTYEEVKGFMGGYSVANISISRKARTAYVTLKNGEDAEESANVLNHKKLLGTEVDVCVNPNETLLCVAHLPLEMKDQEFRQLVMPYGNIEKCFLMRSEEMGISKGYGFVQYTHNRDHTNTARLQIDGKRVQGNVIHCDFVLPDLISLPQLHSTCLFVEHLPIGYSNNEDFRNMCSQHGEPLYCQIAMKDGRALGFAIVEFNDHSTAEKCQSDLNGTYIEDSKIRATFCIPGESAMEICSRLVNALNTNSPELFQTGILPSPQMPNTNQAQGLKNLFHQLQVIQYNVQTLLKNGGGPIPQSGPVAGLLGPPPNTQVSSNPMMQQAISLLVASMQNNPQQQQLMFGLQNLQNILQQQAANDNKTNLGNQQQSILGNPVMFQTNAFLQNIIQQLQQQQQQQQQQTPTNRNQPTSNKPSNSGNPLQALLMNMSTEMAPPPQPSVIPPNQPNNSLASIIGALAGTMNPTPSNLPGNRAIHPNQMPNSNVNFTNYNNRKPGPAMNQMQRPNTPTGNYSTVGGTAANQQQQVQSFLQALLGNVMNTITNLAQNPPSGNVSPTSMNNPVGVTSMPPPPPPGPQMPPPNSRSRSVSRSSSQSRDSSHSWDRSQDRPHPNSRPNNNNINNNTRRSRYQWSQKLHDNWNSVQSEQYEAWESLSSSEGPPHSELGYELTRWNTHPPHAQHSPNVGGMYGDYQSHQQQPLSPGGYDFIGYYNQPRVKGPAGNLNGPCSPPQMDTASIQNLLAQAFNAGAQQQAALSLPHLPGTPQGLKRDSSHFLPNPEPSPDGDYIGQHSQGIGGHYADSYKRKRIL
ncbi:uncharacterized protein LOC141900290 isoform X2 [Tubulanus polymorphus]|uniref:uncharacterized protein LOC141900290 isoform X2 n=1 Tax=Tubulanus polymorphus TaxID=672921 RepID=UPI003DA68280